MNVNSSISHVQSKSSSYGVEEELISNDDDEELTVGMPNSPITIPVELDHWSNFSSRQVLPDIMEESDISSIGHVEENTKIDDVGAVMSFSDDLTVSAKCKPAVKSGNTLLFNQAEVCLQPRVGESRSRNRLRMKKTVTPTNVEPQALMDSSSSSRGIVNKVSGAARVSENLTDVESDTDSWDVAHNEQVFGGVLASKFQRSHTVGSLSQGPIGKSMAAKNTSTDKPELTATEGKQCKISEVGTHLKNKLPVLPTRNFVSSFFDESSGEDEDEEEYNIVEDDESEPSYSIKNGVEGEDLLHLASVSSDHIGQSQSDGPIKKGKPVQSSFSSSSSGTKNPSSPNLSLLDEDDFVSKLLE